MAGLDDILGGGGQGAPGKGKKGSRRMVLVLGGAAVLALIFLLQRRSAAQTQSGAPATTDTTAPVTPATLADNGEQAAALGTSTTDALGQVATALSDQGAAFQTLSDQLSAPVDTTAGATPPIAITVAPGPAGQVNTAVPGRPNAQVNQNKSNPRYGQTYTTKPHPGGGTEHIYPGGKVVVVGAPAKKKKK